MDLNSDLGESFGAWSKGMDEEVIRHVTSINAACGFHAGDPSVMERTVQLAREHGVSVGAHPGYPDLQGFGRRKLAMKPEEARTAVMYQIGALQAFLTAAGMRMQHVKLHGALYNAAAEDEDLARAVCDGIRRVNPELIFLGLSGSRMLKAAGEAGLRTAGEVFADRAYEDDGTLVPRNREGAVLQDAETAAARCIRMIREGVVESIHGKLIPVQADSICVHGDHAAALAFARTIRKRLEEAKIRVCPLTEALSPGSAFPAVGAD